MRAPPKAGDALKQLYMECNALGQERAADPLSEGSMTVASYDLIWHERRA